MAEPPAKRARRGEGSAAWDQSRRSPRPERDSPVADGRKNERNSDRRYRSRSRDRGDTRRRDWDRDGRDGHSGAEELRTRPRRGGGDGDKGRDDIRGRKRDSRGRSKSPSNDSTAASNARARSPPRGPRPARSKEREPNRDRDRDRDRDRHRDRDGRGAKTNGADNSSSRAVPASKGKVNGDLKKLDEDMMNGIDEGDDDDDDAVMRKAMGFSGFKSTKNTKVPGNDKNYGVRKEKKTEYRQYMNRTGGFNRPLSPG